MKPFYLIYHPKRQKSTIGNLTVFHDNFGGNEDPYIWNDKFLHSFCHITQLSNEIGQTNFWISGDSYPNFSNLYCDCVFVVEEKVFWKEQNHIDRSDPMVENDQTFDHHYQWPNLKQHKLTRRKRYTLKGDPIKSFQPQDGKGGLIDILPFLNQNGVTTNFLINSMTSNRGSRPLKLNLKIGQKLYEYLLEEAKTKLIGSQLKDLHPNIQSVGSRCC